MALASCQKNEIPAPEKREVHFTINAGIPQTKTTITDNGKGTYTPSWNKGDEIGIFFTEPKEKVEKVDATFANTNEDGEIASFEGTASVEGEGTFYAFYPKSSFNQHYGDGTVRLDLPAAQKPTSTSFDPRCDILVAQPCDYLADGETVVIKDLFFARLMSVLKINLLGEFAKDEVVESISFTVGGDNPVDITGNAKIDYKTATIKAWNNGSVKRNVVTATYLSDNYITIAGTNNAAYFVVAPVTIPAGAELAFTIKTENYNISKTVTAPSDMSFFAGNVAVINLTIEEENCTAKVEDTSDYSGEWLIVNSDLTRAANAWANGNNLPEFELTTNEGVVLESDGIANCKMIITKEADGYTIQDASGMYLYAAGASDKNHLYGQETKSYWTIEKNETNYVITSLAKDERNILRYNSSSKIFSCYSSGQADVTLYRYSEIKPDTNPSISVAETTNPSIGAEGGDLTFTCTTKNLEGETLEVVEESEYLTCSVAENVVTITVAANEAEESRTLNATIKCGSVEVPVTINQSGKPAEGGTAEPVEATISFESANHRVSQDGNSQVWANGGVTFTNNKSASANAVVGNTNPVRLYANSELVIKADGNITAISFDCNSTSYATALKNSIGDLAKANSDKVTVSLDGSSNTFTVAKLTAQVRMDAMTVTYLTSGSGSGGTTDPETPGEGGETPDPDPDPDPDQPGEAGTSTISVTFADYTAGTQYATNEEHKINNVLTLYTTQCHFTSELRIYSSSTHNGYVISNKLPGAITNLSFNAGNNTDTLNVYGSTDGITWTLVNGVNITSSYKDYSVDFTGSYTYFKMDVAGTNQLRLKSFSVTYKN